METLRREVQCLDLFSLSHSRSKQSSVACTLTLQYMDVICWDKSFQTEVKLGQIRREDRESERRDAQNRVKIGFHIFCLFS